MVSYLEIKKRHVELREKVRHHRNIDIDEFAWGRDEFQAWRNNMTQCFYCGITAMQSEQYYNVIGAFRTPWNNANGMSTRGKSLEIDRYNNMQGYSEANCRCACYYCNNAKSDVFNGDQFMPIGQAIGDRIREALGGNVPH